MTAPEGLSRPTDSETIRVLNDRRSIRKYLPEPVGDAQVEAILEAACRAPTSSNLQAYSILVVRDAEKKALLAETCGKQQHIADCPVFLVFCADLTRIEAALQRGGFDLEDNNLEMGLVSSIDASLVGMAAYAAADSLGLKGVCIGAVRNKPETVAEILGLPKRVYAVFGLCLGYPAAEPKQKPRMPKPGIVHQDTYNAEAALSVIDDYNTDLKAHYDSVGTESIDDAWSGTIVNKFAKRPRSGLRDALQKRGFDFR